MTLTAVLLVFGQLLLLLAWALSLVLIIFSLFFVPFFVLFEMLLRDRYDFTPLRSQRTDC